MMPPILMKLPVQMQPNMTQQEIMVMLQQKMQMMFGIGVIEHPIYGAVLGAIATILILKVEVKPEEYSRKELR